MESAVHELRHVVRPPGQQSPGVAGARPPTIPAQQFVVNLGQEPRLFVALVDLQHHQTAHRRLRAVVALNVVGRSTIRNEAAARDPFGYFHRVREGQILVVQAVHERREVGVPVEQHVAAPARAPHAAHGRDGAVVFRVVGQIPTQNGLHRGENFARRAVVRQPLHLRRAVRLHNRGHLFQRLLRTRVHRDAPLQRHRKIRRVGGHKRVVHFPRRRSHFKSAATFAPRLRFQHGAIAPHRARPVPVVAGLYDQMLGPQRCAFLHADQDVLFAVLRSALHQRHVGGIGAARIQLQPQLGIRTIVGVWPQADLLRPPGRRIGLEKRVLVRVAHTGALQAQRQREAVGQIDVRQNAVRTPRVPAVAQLLLQGTVLGGAQHARTMLIRGWQSHTGAQRGDC